MAKCGFGALKPPYPGQDNFDKFYIDIELKQVATKFGDGESDYIIETKEIIHKRDIAKTIEAQNGEAGIEAFLAPYLASGTPIPSVNISDEILDVSQAPDNLADAAQLGEKALALFKTLDPALTKGRTLEAFLSSLTADELNAFLNSKVPHDEPAEKGDDN